MLPPGHIAAGFLTGYALLKIARPEISDVEAQNLLILATFFGFAPDLDMFFAFFKQKSFLVLGSKDISHRRFISHAPILWLIVGVLIYLLAASTFVKYLGLLVWLGSWSHFILDSIEYGVMWLWPWNNRIYALKNREVRAEITENNFFKHHIEFLKIYSKRLTFYLEILVVITGLAVFFKSLVLN